MINVTQTFLPPIEEYTYWLQKAYNNNWLTNRGELVQLLEAKLQGYLGVDWLTITNNGTIPMQIALKLLGKQGEIITTPFSYVATTSSIVWENCKPVFVDIEAEYLSIDENKIEDAITEHTTAIMDTHVFGIPCNVEAIEIIAKKYNLAVIYDAAHCFGVNYKGESIFNYDEISTCSFHATKLFHTGEGGAMFTNNKELQGKLFYSHNFGHKGPIEFYGLGINGKISELQAAMGLAVFPYMDKILERRKQICELYDETLDFGKLQKMKLRDGIEWNYSYYPIMFSSEERLLEVEKELNSNNIFPRRYFYPSLNTLNYVDYKPMPISEDIASRIMCLPLYHDLSDSKILEICKILER